jgi:CMP-N-acetylneuraminic acid synthetase
MKKLIYLLAFLALTGCKTEPTPEYREYNNLQWYSNQDGLNTQFIDTAYVENGFIYIKMTKITPVRRGDTIINGRPAYYIGQTIFY